MNLAGTKMQGRYGMMARSGVAVIASVHGASLRCRRRALAPGCAKKTFASIAILTGVGKTGAPSYSGEGEKLA